MKKIAVIFGGCSSEYDVSLASASSVIPSINKDKYEVYLIGVTKTGDFYLYDGDISNIEKDLWFSTKCQKITFSVNRSDHGFINLKNNKLTRIDLVFPIMHGRNGEDGRFQGLLELAGIPYVGCDMLASAIGMNKYVAHKLAESHGILVPKSYLFTINDDINMVKEKINDLKMPLYVKPLRAGSSLGISKVNKIADLEKAIKESLLYDNKYVIEEGIDGFEVGCAIMGNTNKIIGEVDEIDLVNEFFDYDKKYKSNVLRSVLPARIPKAERAKIKEVALKLYQILGCKDYSRIDMFYTKDKKIVFNEVNTIPGFTLHSRFPSMLKQVGYSFPEIINELIEMAIDEKI